jgi:Glycosyltransferase sugar-binding region containing DXD motif
MILASILITSDGKIPSPLPPIIRENIDSFKRTYAGIEHILFDDGMIRDFLSTNFDGAVLHAYEELVPYAYKADLARYCILHKLGGVYADLSFLVVSQFLPVAGKLAVFRDVGPTSPWDIYNGMIGAPAGHKALAKAIEMICDNVKRRYYGSSPLCPTGPTLFGKAVAITCEAEELIVGEVFRPPGSDANYSLIDLGTSTLIAVNRKKSVGTIRTLGIASDNNYNDLWSSQGVYRSDAGRPKIWNAKWLHDRHFTRGVLTGDSLDIEGTEGGILMWGPYVPLEPGDYLASIFCAGGDVHGNFMMDIATRTGEEILTQVGVTLPRSPGEPFRAALAFTLAAATPQIEVRLHAAGSHKVKVKQVQLTKRL